ncbi:MAG: hypothetical protein AB7R90_19405 [Reyranellaceae bacterium]
MSTGANSERLDPAEAHRRELRRRWHEQAKAQRKLVEAWEADHTSEMAGMHELVQAEIIGLAREKAQAAVQRGASRIVLTRAQMDDRLRQLVCRMRRARHGPIEQAGSAWQAQIDAICREIGWVWAPAATGRLGLGKGGEG